jgi:hypothetical protein
MRELCEDAANLKLVATGWLPWARQLVGTMHLLLQPSFTESFNVVTADGVHQGVPSVVSDAIDWAPARWQANPDDAEDVVRAWRSACSRRRRPSTTEGRRSRATYRRGSKSGPASSVGRAGRSGLRKGHRASPDFQLGSRGFRSWLAFGVRGRDPAKR